MLGILIRNQLQELVEAPAKLLCTVGPPPWVSPGLVVFGLLDEKSETFN